MSNSSETFRRAQAAELARRLTEPRRFLQIVAGPRQVGKTTLVQQVAETLKPPVRYASADEPTLRGADWIALPRRRLGVGGAPLAAHRVREVLGRAGNLEAGEHPGRPVAPLRDRVVSAPPEDEVAQAHPTPLSRASVRRSTRSATNAKHRPQVNVPVSYNRFLHGGVFAMQGFTLVGGPCLGGIGLSNPLLIDIR